MTNCEGTGYIPHRKNGGFLSHHLVHKNPEYKPLLDNLCDEAEAKKPSDDGWHFIKCPDCNGTGKKITYD